MDYTRLLRKHQRKYAARVPWRFGELLVRKLKIDPQYAAPAAKNVDRLVTDIDENGIKWPICVHYRDRTIHVIVGRHRVLAAQRLGLKTVKAVIWDVHGDYPAPLIANPLAVFGAGAHLNPARGTIEPADGYFAHAA